jgi:metal-responsive CopG/Arc/MetJ family transcriptional regulator
VATIQVVLDDDLLDLADEFARKKHVNRSALIREALRAHLKRLHYQELEKQEREAYRQKPEDRGEVALWEGVADWPED